MPNGNMPNGDDSGDNSDDASDSSGSV
jgi:hypothetical protein